MSVSLCCPNCGSTVGEASHEDNYVHHFYQKNNKGEALCQYCGTGKKSKIELMLYLLAFSFTIAIIIIDVLLK
jgi:hypothetical protein